MITTVESDCIKFYNKITGEYINEVPEKAVKQIRFEPNGNFFVTLSHFSDVLKIWDAAIFEVMWEIENSDEIAFFDINSEGTKIVTICNRCKIWNFDTLELIYSSYFLSGICIVCVYFSPTENKLLYQSNTKKLSIMDLDKNEEINIKSNRFIDYFSYSPDGSKIVIVTDRSICIKETITYQTIFEIELNGDVSFSFSPDSSLFIYSLNNEIYLYETLTFKLIKQVELDIYVKYLSFTNDGIFVCTKYNKIIKYNDILELLDFEIDDVYGPNNKYFSIQPENEIYTGLK